MERNLEATKASNRNLGLQKEFLDKKIINLNKENKLLKNKKQFSPDNFKNSRFNTLSASIQNLQNTLRIKEKNEKYNCGMTKLQDDSVSNDSTAIEKSLKLNDESAQRIINLQYKKDQQYLRPQGQDQDLAQNNDKQIF